MDDSANGVGAGAGVEEIFDLVNHVFHLYDCSEGRNGGRGLCGFHHFLGCKFLTRYHTQQS